MLGFFLFRFFFLVTLFAQSLSAREPISFTAGTGYRQDSLTWNIGSPTGSPNVLSELSWKQLQMINSFGEIAVNSPNGFFCQIRGDYATIFHGTVRDSDWHENNRKNEFSRTRSDASKGEAFDLSFAFTPQAWIFCNRFRIFPQVGVNYAEQHLRMYGGDQLIDTEHHQTGPIHGLHSNYRANWVTPWLGFGIATQQCGWFVSNLNLRGGYNRYWGSGHWNLREDIADDFKHRGWGFGAEAMLTLTLTLKKSLWLEINGCYKNHWTQEGWDRIHVIEANKTLTSRQPLNRVRWQSGRLTLSLSTVW